MAEKTEGEESNSKSSQLDISAMPTLEELSPEDLLAKAIERKKNPVQVKAARKTPES